jgi:hypothetical protein
LKLKKQSARELKQKLPLKQRELGLKKKKLQLKLND